jgi:hypothetical protein
MEFAKDLLASLHQRLGTGSNAVPAGACDWHALSAQLHTAHAARIALQRDQVNSLRRLGGSFGSGSAFAVQSPGEGSPAVNPTDLADGKAPDGIAAPVAVHDAVGGRG